MIFNVEKKLYFKAIRAISCIFTKGCFLWGWKGGPRIPTRPIIRGI